MNRAKVAQLVFADPEARQRLNDIVHPRVARELQERLQELEQQGADLVLVEVPLLFEAGLERPTTGSSWFMSIRRTRSGGCRNGTAAGPRRSPASLQAQWPLGDKAARADDVVDNRGSLAETRKQVRKIWAELQKIGKSS